jgi:hypothetical protein
MLMWVSRVNYSSNFRAALLPTLEDDESGDWFLGSPQFEAWSRNSSPRGLVLTGICKHPSTQPQLYKFGTH